MHILGASGHAKVLADILDLNGQKISGVWDDNEELATFLNRPIDGSLMVFRNLLNTTAIIAVGDNSVRKSISEKITARFAIVTHPTAVVSPSTTIGNGTVIMANTTLNAASTIGCHVIVNTNASVDHDCQIADYVHIAPNAALAGNVIIGEGTHIGIGTSIIQGITIGKWATIGAGAVIITDIPDYAVVVGNPGRIIKYNDCLELL